MKQSSINPAINKLETPPIPLAQSWLREYNGQHGASMDFSQAVPDFLPHPALLTGLAELAGATESCGYGEIKGEPSLRKAYASSISTFYQLTLTADNVHITSGCNQAFVAALITLAAHGDTIIMTNPGYFNHESTAKMLGINLRKVDCSTDNHFIPEVRQLESCIDDSVKAIALVSPNNPCGTVYDASSLRKILQLCQKHGIWLILDETYRDFIKSHDTHSSPTPCHNLFATPDWQDNFIQLYSFSKSFCIPGHRLGAITAGPTVIEAISRVMDNIQICPPRAAQLALAKQLPRLDTWRQANAQTIARRTQCFENAMHSCPEWITRSIGAYFAYVEHPYQNQLSIDIAKRLAGEFGLLTLPGSFFGEQQDQFLRVAFANATEQSIEQLAKRLQLVTKAMPTQQAPTPVTAD